MFHGGYLGRILAVDLTIGQVGIVPLNQEYARKYIGGTGLATRYLYDLITPLTQPTDPETPLIFMTGPACGTRSITSGRHHLVSLSPLTGIYGESDVGGAWGTELKRAGFDGIIITGKSPHPVYLWIRDGQAEIRPADHVWGLDPYEIDPVLKAETDPKANMAVIGTAAPGTLIMGVMHDGSDIRAAGRCGLGSVMADKKLKAVVVRGVGKIPVADDQALKQLVKKHVPTVSERLKDMRRYGTPLMVPAAEQIGSMPLQNWKYPSRWQHGAEKLSGPALKEKFIVRPYFCQGCVIGCGNVGRIESGPYKTVVGAGPEYEALTMLGADCLVDDLEAITFANELCNRYGIDVIETGSLVAFAMEAFENGLLTEADTGGLALKFGDPEAVIECVRMIGEGAHIGAVLNKGYNHVLAVLGAEAADFAVQVKGLAIPAHDPRAYNGLACSYATGNRGAHHTSGQTHLYEHRLKVPELNHEPPGRFEVAGKGALTALTQNIMNVLDSVKSCKFAQNGGWTIGPVTEAFRYITGRPDTLDRMLAHGERSFNLKRLINQDRGISRQDDTLPQRMLTLAKTAEGYTPNLPPLDRMLDEYYQARGWTPDGRLEPEAIERLEIP
ncbi:MAG: aldehyde ferredoxin oxidoreductase family protein [Thermodesulfobacteriota bacterium]